jgi:hypothetical protein
VACSQSEAATPRAAGTEASPAPAAKSKVDTETFTLEMKATGKYQAAKEGTVEVTLVPKGVYHINDKYPIKFKATDPAPAGIKYPKPILKKDDGAKVTDQKAVFTVPFIAEKAGKATVSGVLSFSVCSEANCLMERTDLEASVDVE